MRSARRVGPLLRRPGPGTRAERLVIWANTVFAQGLLLVLAWLAGRSFGFRFFVAPARPRDFAAAAAALAACFALREAARRLRTEKERRTLAVYRIAPRSPIEWVAWSIVALAAAVAEEIAYRGVGVAILWFWSGRLAIAILVCSLAFAAAHALQGLKSAAIIFGFALVMHALVVLTGTLVLAMAVHLIYDVVAGLAIARAAARFDREAKAASSVPPGPSGVPA